MGEIFTHNPKCEYMSVTDRAFFLLQHYNIEDHFSHKFKNFTTPGRLIKFSEIVGCINTGIGLLW